MTISDEQKKKIQKIEDFGKKADVHPSLPIVDELENIKEVLITIANKEVPEIPEFPEIPEPLEEVSVKNFPENQQVTVMNWPEMKESKPTDMAETNYLLRSLLAKEASEPEEVDIVVSLKII